MIASQLQSFACLSVNLLPTELIRKLSQRSYLRLHHESWGHIRIWTLGFICAFVSDHHCCWPSVVLPRVVSTQIPTLVIYPRTWQESCPSHQLSEMKSIQRTLLLIIKWHHMLILYRTKSPIEYKNRGRIYCLPGEHGGTQL